MSRYLTSSIAALVFTAVMAASASAGLFHHKRHCEPSCCVPEPTCCVEPTCCMPEPTCCVEPSCCVEPCCPRITYHYRGCCRRNSGCCEPATYETVLHVTSPETCCTA